MAPRMSEAGASVFLDLVDVKYGDNFRAQILDQLATANELCVLLTRTSILRPWVFAELGVAVSRGIHIVAVVYGVLESELQANGVLSILGTNSYLEMDDFDIYVKQLEARVKEFGNA